MGTPGASPRHCHHQQPAQRLQQEPLPLFAQMMAQTVRSQGEICCQGMSQIHHDARAARSEMMQSFQVRKISVGDGRTNIKSREVGGGIDVNTFLLTRARLVCIVDDDRPL
jgi:hypothetical protein